MPAAAPPRVSIGLPVYNGGSDLAAALDSLVRQSFADIEIVISDNVSTDGTEALCRAYALRDPRIVYIRQPTPLAIFDNFAFVLHMARAPYFMWAAHDDLRDLDFVAKLLEALEANPRAVLAFGDIHKITADGLLPLDIPFANAGLSPRERLRHPSVILCFHIYGLWRTAVLRRIPLIEQYWGEDKPVVMAGSLLGDFIHVRGVRFLWRPSSRNLVHWERPPGWRGLLYDLWRYLHLGWSILRYVWLSGWVVGRACGPAPGALAAWSAFLLVWDQASDYFRRRLGGVACRAS